MIGRIREWLHERPTFGKKSTPWSLRIQLVLDKTQTVELVVPSGPDYEDRLVLEKIEQNLLTWFVEDTSSVFQAEHLTIRRCGIVAILCKIETVNND